MSKSTKKATPKTRPFLPRLTDLVGTGTSSGRRRIGLADVTGRAAAAREAVESEQRRLRAVAARLAKHPKVRQAYMSNGALRLVLTTETLVLKRGDEAEAMEEQLQTSIVEPDSRS